MFFKSENKQFNVSDKVNNRYTTFGRVMHQLKYGADLVVPFSQNIYP